MIEMPPASGDFKSAKRRRQGNFQQNGNVSSIMSSFHRGGTSG
jgi:hypothetical protein